MVCIHCGSKTQVINSRHQVRNNQVWRRRQCKQCKAVFTTEETPQYNSEWVIKTKNGALRPFSRDKLQSSIYISCKHRNTALEDASGLTDTIIKKLSQDIQNGVLEMQTINQVTQVALNRFDKAASVHYQAFHKD